MEVLQLLKDTLDGNKEAFNDVINIYERKLYIIAKSRLNNEWDIKDVVQETLSYAYFNLDKLNELEKFNSWITKICINKCNKIFIFKKRNISYESFAGENIIQADNEIDQIESDTNFFDIINFLSKKERTLITMYYLNDYTTKEMSEILNINESTIRSDIRRIKIKIRNKIEEESN